MSQTCGCGYHTGAIATPMPAMTADQTVEEVKQRPRALETLQRLGINHCCGAHLTLREAAAATGIELRVLLEALDGAPVARP
jgi:iron-sulfur cluster repair protein YtfE (RIC family)